MVCVNFPFGKTRFAWQKGGQPLFGYIKPVKQELKIKDYEAYQGVYCGLCKQLGRVYGPFYRFTLSYDFAFLAMLSMALGEEPPRFHRENCVAHPLKKRAVCQANSSLDKAAAMAALLLYYKLLDNLHDGSWYERLSCFTAYPFARKAFQKAEKKFPETAQVMAKEMAAQTALEKERCPVVDRACEPTAHIMEAIFEALAQDSLAKRALGRMGYLLGRWVYLADALDDWEEDRKTGNYNPFLYSAQGEISRGDAVRSLYLTAAEAVKAYQLLPVNEMFRDILDNTMYLGLRASVDQLCPKGRGMDKQDVD